MPLRSGFAIAVAASALLAATSAHADGTRGWGLHGRHAFDDRGLVPGAGAHIAPYGRARAYPFANELQSMYTEHWDDGLRVAWISFTKGDKDLIEQRRTLGAEARKLALNFPVGMDMDPEAPVLVRYSVARGTPTIVAVDRAGRVAWYKMDPTYRDFLLARQVVTRLLHGE